MQFAGLVKTTLIDYPGKVAAVVFTQGCNFRCGFCHNPDLIPIKSEKPDTLVSKDEVMALLIKRQGVLDGVVITGGEPLVTIGVEDFIKEIKDLGYLVKLDTNGSNPGLLRKLIDSELIDYVAMDIKADLGNYAKVCGFQDLTKIKESVDILLQGRVDYEFRTTVLPYYHQIDDFKRLGELIKGAKLYTIQGFRPQITLDEALETEKPFTREQLLLIRDVVSPFVQRVVIHENLS